MSDGLQQTPLFKNNGKINHLAELIRINFPESGFWWMGQCLHFCKLRVSKADKESIRLAVRRLGWSINYFDFIVKNGGLDDSAND